MRDNFTCDVDPYSYQQQKEAIKTWIKWKTRTTKELLMITLKTKFNSNGRPMILSLDPAKEKLERFILKMNHKIFKTSYLKHGKRLDIIPAFELDSDSDFHFHCVVGHPRFKDGQLMPLSDLSAMSQNTWRATDGWKDDVHLEPIHSSNGVDYCSKFRKGLEKENIDWSNTHFV